MSEDKKTILQRIRQSKLIQKGLIAGAFFGTTLGSVKACSAYEENKEKQEISNEFQNLVEDWKDVNINADTFLIDKDKMQCAAVYKISPQLQAELASELQSYEQTKDNIRATLSETSDVANKDLYSAVNRADLVDIKKALINGANVNMRQGKLQILDIALEKVHQTKDEHYYKSALMLVRAGARVSKNGLSTVKYLENQEWKQNLDREIEKHYQPKTYSERSSQTIALQQALDSLSLSMPRDQGHILKDFAQKGVLMNSLKRFQIPKTHLHEYKGQCDISEKSLRTISVILCGPQFRVKTGVATAVKMKEWYSGRFNLGGKTDTRPAKVQMENYIKQMQTQKETAKSILSTIGKENLIAPLQKVEIKHLNENTEFKNRSYQTNQRSGNTSSVLCTFR